MDASRARLAVGFLGQACRRGSVVPVAFWHFSIVGGVILLASAIYGGDLVFSLGQATGLLVYSRNLYFIGRQPPG